MNGAILKKKIRKKSVERENEGKFILPGVNVVIIVLVTYSVVVTRGLFVKKKMLRLFGHLQELI